MTDRDPSAELQARIAKQFFGGPIPEGLEYGSYHMARDQHEQGAAELQARLDAILAGALIPDPQPDWEHIGHTIGAALVDGLTTRTYRLHARRMHRARR